MTRWHGTINGNRFVAMAFPTARAPPGQPTWAARPPYVATRPRAMPWVARRTFSRNVPHRSRANRSSEKATALPSRKAAMRSATWSTSRHEDAATCGYNFAARFSAELFSEAISTRVISGPLASPDQASATGPKGVRLTVFTFIADGRSVADRQAHLNPLGQRQRIRRGHAYLTARSESSPCLIPCSVGRALRASRTQITYHVLHQPFPVDRFDDLPL